MSTTTSEFKIHHINGALGPFNVDVNIKSSTNDDEIVKFEISSQKNGEVLNIDSLDDFVSLILILSEVNSALSTVVKEY